jgi:hypothetical protein
MVLSLRMAAIKNIFHITVWCKDQLLVMKLKKEDFITRNVDC